MGFRHWRETDGEHARALWGDPAVSQYITKSGTFTEEEIAARLAHEIKTQTETGVSYWPIFLRTTGEHVGCCGLRPYRPQADIFELGVHVRSPFWRQGLAAEAVRTVVEYAFRELKVHGLFAGHNPGHEASRALLTKLGFQYTHDEPYEPTGLKHPSYLLVR